MKPTTRNSNSVVHPVILFVLGLLMAVSFAAASAEESYFGNGLENVNLADRVEIFRVKDKKTTTVTDKKTLDRIKKNMVSFVFGDEGDAKTSKERYVVRFFNSQNVEVVAVKVLAYDWVWIEGDKNPRRINVGRVDLSTLQKAF